MHLNKRTIAKFRADFLSSEIKVHPELSRAAIADGSAQHLARSTGQIYQRQVKFISSILDLHFHRQRDEVKILDWGCGRGQCSFLLREECFDVTGCDLERPLNESYTDNAFSQLQAFDPVGAYPIVPLKDNVLMPFTDSSFDCIVSFGVLEHVQNDAKSLRELRRLLKPNGLIFIFFLPYYYSWTQRLAHAMGNFYHDRLYKHTQLAQMAIESDLVVMDSWTAQFLPKNRIPYLPWLENLDRVLTDRTPLRHISTNIEAILTIKAGIC